MGPNHEEVLKMLNRLSFGANLRKLINILEQTNRSCVILNLNLDHLRSVLTYLAGWQLHELVELVGYRLAAAPAFFEVVENRVP